MARNKMMAKGKKLDQPAAVPTASGQGDYQAKSDMHTLAASAEIIADAKRHSAAKKMAAQEAKKYSKICK